PGLAVRRAGVLGCVIGFSFGVAVGAVMELPSQTSMRRSCCTLYQIARIEDSCGKVKNPVIKSRGVRVTADIGAPEAAFALL
ncbi:MAG TPA: hypothetical protein VFU50_03840, partial [Terriglobales bacterium]|nr:hypothetical protein [Terriglobales bacterium]